MLGLRKPLFMMLLTALIVTAPACQSNGKDVKRDAAVKEITSQPVTLKVMPYSVNLADSEFNQLMAEPVKQKYPNITLELVRMSSNDELEKYVASGEMADIVFTGQGLRALLELNVATDLNPLIKEHGIDLGRFNPQAISAVKEYAPRGELFMLPFSINFSVLFYNKDLFDKFAVSYPKDGMLWEEAIELGKKLTRKEDGIQYLGLNAQSITHLASQLSLTYVDPKTNKVSFLTDGWQRVFRLYAAIAELSTNLSGNGGLNNLFLKDRVLAMFGDYGAKIGQIQELADQGNPINWDMAAMPVHSVAPGKAFGFVAQSFVLSAMSKNKEAALLVMDYLTSEEHQLKIVKKGRQSALQGSKFQEGFGSELSVLRGKNVQAIFKNAPAPYPQPSPYSDDLDNQVKKELTSAANAVASGKKDVNTALRDLEEIAARIYSAP
jgi:multiple sugar transport system substrate-binding protein